MFSRRKSLVFLGSLIASIAIPFRWANIKLKSDFDVYDCHSQKGPFKVTVDGVEVACRMANAIEGWAIFDVQEEKNHFSSAAGSAMVWGDVRIRRLKSHCEHDEFDAGGQARLLAKPHAKRIPIGYIWDGHRIVAPSPFPHDLYEVLTEFKTGPDGFYLHRIKWRKFGSKAWICSQIPLDGKVTDESGFPFAPSEIHCSPIATGA